ncbi:MAG: helix-turn-helix domain-containing protein [Oscillospiraceae bacterium]|jgi:transcriptional regulator with XRE-family HTH domain|nr:helix-turn-helix domain-containing protein [Oscillospiraceae bacterium]
MKPCNEILREMREDRDLKQSDIAAIIGTTQQQYSKYETGESELPLRALALLADHYNVSADYLMGRIDGLSGVPGLSKKVVDGVTLKDVMIDVICLGTAGRAAVVEYIALQKMREKCSQKKKDGTAGRA